MMIHKLSHWTVLLFYPSTISSSGTPSYVKNFLSAFPASAFLAITFISENYVPLEKTCAYWFLSKDFTRPPMVYVAHMPVRLLLWNTLSTLYRLARSIISERVSLCVVFVIVSFTY